MQPITSEITIMTWNWRKETKTRMKDMGITQDDLIRPLNVQTRGTVGLYLSEKNPRNPTPEQLIAFARELKWSLDEMLTGKTTYQIGEPKTGYSSFNRQMLSEVLRAVTAALDDIQVPTDHPLRKDPLFSELVAGTYQFALSEQKVNVEQLQDKITLLLQATG